MPVKGLNLIPSVVLEKQRQIAYYRELLINSYVIFRTDEEFEKSKNDNFRLL